MICDSAPAVSNNALSCIDEWLEIRTFVGEDAVSPEEHDEACAPHGMKWDGWRSGMTRLIYVKEICPIVYCLRNIFDDWFCCRWRLAIQRRDQVSGDEAMQLCSIGRRPGALGPKQDCKSTHSVRTGTAQEPNIMKRS
jgi:hypothetical protein